MTASARRRLAALTGHATLLAGILAIVAGILGMHTLTGTHAGHTLGAAAPPSSAAAAVSTALAGGHSHGSSAHTASGAAVSGATEGPAASCTGSFAGADLPGAACTPLAKAGSLAAPAPGSAGHLADAAISSGAAALGLYTYLPDGPSPGDLSISRT
ncbi:MAG TPA: hypothetical protein VJ617_18740 [Arthrobacter sp.]|nr:hypothetical protein [Arthrobacter sp.]